MDVLEGMHPLSDKEVEEDLPLCSKSQVNTAIRDYQIKYKLPVTGILDDVTRKFMSTSRCGNADKDAPEDPTLPGVFEENSDNLYNSNSRNSIIDSVNRRRWRRNAKDTVLMNVLTSESVRHQNILRRTKYIKEYAEKYKIDLLKPYTVKERQKRSVIAHVRNSSLDGEPVWDGQKFTKNYIRWRMLRDGFSTRIPVEEQRASLQLAFRMWSEVIPIIFEEDKTGDINRVDIEIAFGRGNSL
jgi:matrix metalloproteinase-21